MGTWAEKGVVEQSPLGARDPESGQFVMLGKTSKG